MPCGVPKWQKFSSRHRRCLGVPVPTDGTSICFKETQSSVGIFTVSSPLSWSSRHTSSGLDPSSWDPWKGCFMTHHVRLLFVFVCYRFLPVLLLISTFFNPSLLISTWLSPFSSSLDRFISCSRSASLFRSRCCFCCVRLCSTFRVRSLLRFRPRFCSRF